MSSLIDRLENAREGSRLVDAEVGVIVDFQHEGCPTTWRELVEIIGIERAAEAADSHHSFWSHALPHYSTSIDAALTALPEGWRSGFEQAGMFDTNDLCEAWVWPFESGFEPDWQNGDEGYRSDPKSHRAAAPTPALALITAILKALTTEKEG